VVSALLSFNGGFVDTAGFLGLQGLFTAHVTGNLVTLAATLLSGTHGVIAKLLALPEIILIVALARIAGGRANTAGVHARLAGHQRNVRVTGDLLVPVWRSDWQKLGTGTFDRRKNCVSE